jgi:hypothetical protein
MSQDAESYNPSLRPPGNNGPGAPARVDVSERGADVDGTPQVMDRRLFMQLLGVRAPVGADPDVVGRELVDAVAAAHVSSVVYDDVNDPRGFGLLTWSEDPAHFVNRVRPLFGRQGLREVELSPSLAMMGRTYSQGYEQDLRFWLLDRPRQTVLDSRYPWAVWYPLRRTGAFERLDPKEQGSILREHAVIGRSYGSKDLAHDIRLACHGLDARDNEFVIGLVGAELHPLSHVVQTMRRTRQTSEYIEQMGPFFVGRVRARHSEG